MSRRLLRSLAVAVLLAGTVTGSTGCIVAACPAIGWISSMELDASAVSGVSAVQFCVDAECSPTPGQAPTSSSNLFTASPREGVWDLSFGMSAPAVVEIRLFDAQGTIIHESEQPIEWTHSTDVCGGPSIAEPLILTP